VILLDTSFLIDLLRGDERVLNFLEELSEPILTSISLFELLSYPNLKKEEKNVIERIFGTYQVYHFDEAAARSASEIAKRLSKLGKKINVVDIMIAGIAISKGINRIVTADKDFEIIGAIADIEVHIYR